VYGIAEYVGNSGEQVVKATDLYGNALDKKIGELTKVRKPEKKDKKSPDTIRKIKQ
jgi:hypothetical protein